MDGDAALSASVCHSGDGVPDAYAFSLEDPENILRVIRGEEIGTLLSSDEETAAEFYPEA